MVSLKEFTKEEMRFIIDIAENGLDNEEQDERFEAIKRELRLSLRFSTNISYLTGRKGCQGTTSPPHS